MQQTDPIAPAAPAAEKLVDQQVYRNVVGHFASGVTVITTNLDGVPYGTTASSVTSLSMDPPMFLVCLNRSSSTHDAVERAGVFGVNILAEGQSALARQFARKGTDKFAGADYRLDDDLGVPLLDGALATIVCRVTSTAVGGTHTVFLGTVADADATGEAPLAYYRGAFGRFDDTQEDVAYDGVREWVLERRTPVGDALDLEELAGALRTDRDSIHNALIKLVADALVTRDDLGAFRVSPLTAEITDYMLDTRTRIEHEVLRSHLGRITLDDLAALEAIVRELDAEKAAPVPSLDRFLDAVGQYHERVLRLARSKKLSAAYARLGVSTVWRRAFADGPWADRFETRHLAALTAALRAGDESAAAAELGAHAETVKALAHAVLDARGGTM